MTHIAENKTHQIQALLVRFERNNKIIQRLSKKLASYIFEPNNPSCFEKLYEIKKEFKIFAKHQKRISELLKSTKNTNPVIQKEIELHLERYHQLESDIEVFLLETYQHH